MGGVATKLIERNTTVPTSKSQVFSTAADNQTQVDIHIVQGERAMATDNKSLGRFILDGIAPAPRGMPQIEVSFDVDANGILNVTAKDKATGKTQSIKIEASSGLTDADIERMKKDAEAHAESDKAVKELAEARNVADQLVYTAEKALADHKDAITEEVKNAVTVAVEKVKTARSGADKAALDGAVQELSSSMQKIGEHIAKAGEQGTSDSGQKEDKNIRDVDAKDDKTP